MSYSGSDYICSFCYLCMTSLVGILWTDVIVKELHLDGYLVRNLVSIFIFENANVRDGPFEYYICGLDDNTSFMILLIHFVFTE